MANTSRGTDKNSLKKQLGYVAKGKGNSFYGKMIEDLGRHKTKKFTREEIIVDKALSSLFFDNLEEVVGAYDIKSLSKLL